MAIAPPEARFKANPQTLAALGVAARSLNLTGLTQLDDFWGRSAPPKIVQSPGFSWSVHKSYLKSKIQNEMGFHCSASLNEETR